MKSCIFCGIIKGAIPSEIIYQDKYIVAFNDIKPMAPIHILMVPKKHIKNFIDIQDDDNKFIHAIIKAIKKLAKKYEIVEKGFRQVINTKDDGGQTVDHLHWHLLGGRKMTWPPG